MLGNYPVSLQLGISRVVLSSVELVIEIELVSNSEAFWKETAKNE
jgi:hypothetical protein